MMKTPPWHRTMLLLVAFIPGCFGIAPDELNLAFRLERNQPITTSVRIGGKDGRFVIATGTSQTVMNSAFAGVPPGSKLPAQHMVIGGRRGVRIKPVVHDLQDMADGLLGADAWRGKTLTLDYRRGLASIGGSLSSAPAGAGIRSNPGLPTLMIRIDGRPLRVIVDTAVPDTIIVPASFFPRVTPGRIVTSVEIGDVKFNQTSILVEGKSEARIGNRLLSHFLVTIDDRAGNVTLHAQ